MKRPTKKKKPVCPRCRHPGYDQGFNPSTNRPDFTCQKCKHTWCAGITGGEWNRSPFFAESPRTKKPLYDSKWLRTPDDWFPCYDDGKLVRATLCEVLHPTPGEPRYRVCVWGADDFGLERDYHDLEEARRVYDALPDPVTKKHLEDTLGFWPA